MAENELDIYDEVAGQGFENMGVDKFSIPMLKIAQPTSSIVADGNVAMGDFYNSVNGKSYGSSIEVIPVYFDTVWLEWKPNMGGLVGRHKPYSIKTTGDVYTGLHTLDGNDIQEAWCYFVLIKGHEDEGPLMLSATSTNIRYCKIWNGLLNESKLPSGKHAPLFCAYWKLESRKNKNDKGTFFVLGEGKTAAIERTTFVPKEIYLNNVKLIVENASQMFAQASVTEDSEASTPYAIEDKTEQEF